MIHKTDYNSIDSKKMARKGVLGQNSIESKDQFLLENSRDSRESFNQVTKVATAVTARKAQILN